MIVAIGMKKHITVHSLHVKTVPNRYITNVPIITEAFEKASKGPRIEGWLYVEYIYVMNHSIQDQNTIQQSSPDFANIGHYRRLHQPNTKTQ